MNFGKHLYHLIECKNENEIDQYLNDNVDPTSHQILREKLNKKSKNSITKAIANTISAKKINLNFGDVVGKYNIKIKLDQGGMSNLYLATRTDNATTKNFVIKIENTVIQDRRSDNTEAQTLFNLSGGNENICTVYDAGIMPTGQKYIVIEYIDGLTLDLYFKENNTKTLDILRFFITICETFGYIHQHNIIHGDIKPENILINKKGEVKVIDFGISTHKNNKNRINAATIDYAPPEQLNGEPLGTYTDVYAIGVSLYNVLTERYLFESIDGSERKKQNTIEDSTVNSRHFSKLDDLPLKYKLFSSEIIDVIKKCTSQNPNDRYKDSFQLATDLTNFITFESLNEIGTTNAKKSIKLLFRNSFIAISLIALASVFLLASTIVYFQNQILTEQKDLMIIQKNNLIIEQDKINTLLSQTQEIINYSDFKNRIGDVINVKQLLKRGLDNIQKNENIENDIKAKLFTILGDSYYGLGEYSTADKLYTQAFNLYYHEFDVVSEQYLKAKTKILNIKSKYSNVGLDYPIAEASRLLSKIIQKGFQNPYELDVIYIFSIALQSSVFDLSQKEKELNFDFRKDVLTIKEKMWKYLSPEQKIKLLNFQIMEIYYRFGSDYNNATGALSEEEYKEAIPLLQLINSYADTGLETLQKNKIEGVLEIDLLVWKFRINYELKNYDKGDKFSRLALSKAIEIYGEHHTKIVRLYTIQYAMHSTTDMNLAVKDLILAKDTALKIKPDDIWGEIYFLDLLAFAHLDAGDWSKSKEITALIFEKLSHANLANINTEGFDVIHNSIKRDFNHFDAELIKNLTQDDFDEIKKQGLRLWPNLQSQADKLAFELIESFALGKRNENILANADNLYNTMVIHEPNSSQFNSFFKTNVISYLIIIYDKLGETDRLDKAAKLYFRTPKEELYNLSSLMIELQTDITIYPLLKKNGIYLDLVSKFKSKTNIFLMQNNMTKTFYQEEINKL